MNIFRFIDTAINRTTMYRLLVYGLGGLLVIALVFSLTGMLSIRPLALLSSIIVILTAAFIADKLLPIVFNVAANKDSSLITALILCFIMPPSAQPRQLALLALAGMVAIASKYLLVIHRKHLFNPAAFAAIVLGLSSLAPATWWIGTPILVPFTILLGLVMLRKVRKFQLFGVFALASIVVTIAVGLLNSVPVPEAFMTLLLSSPFIFLGTIMLTEPSTTPPRLYQQYLYGGLVGALFTSQLHYGILSATPELALIVGNIYAYVVSPKFKLKLVFKQKQQLAGQMYDFAFSTDKKLTFLPGQYLEWTLPLAKSDARGNRRTFSIASAPSDGDIHIAIRVPEKKSAFKTALMGLEPGQSLQAGQLAGDFILPQNTNQKIVLIAGGIGVTPFVSMAKHMINTKQKRDITLFYLVGSPTDYSYVDVWARASEFGFTVVPVLTDVRQGQPKTWPGLVGKLTDEIIEKQIPDYKQRRFYISGPPGLVASYRDSLTKLSVKRRDIVTDLFTGY